MDLAVTKYIPLGFLTDDAQVCGLRVDIINLFNDRNFNGFNAVTGLRQRTTSTSIGVSADNQTVSRLQFLTLHDRRADFGSRGGASLYA